MLNLSFSEIILIIVLIIILLDHDEAARCFISIKRFFSHINSIYQKYLQYINRELEDTANHNPNDKNININDKSIDSRSKKHKKYNNDKR